MRDARRVRTLIARGADPNAKNKDGEPALYTAVFWSRREVVDVLLAGGADPNAKNKDGETSFAMAMRRSESEIVDALLVGGADAHATDDKMQTLLHHAADRHCVPVVACLLKHGANPTLPDEIGMTPLHLCVQGARGLDAPDEIVSVIKLLADHGADVNARTQEGKTALDMVDSSLRYAVRNSVRAKLERIRECLLAFNQGKAQRVSASLEAVLPSTNAATRGRL